MSVAGIKIFSGRASKILANNIASSFGIALGDVKVTSFSDGEFQPSFEETVRGQDVFIVQSTMPPADNLCELLLMVDAAKRASAGKIIVVIPYFGFARQDRKDKPRVAIGAKLVANMLMASGIDRIMTMDLHADQIQGFFEVPVDHLFGSTIFYPEIEKLNNGNLIMAAPDAGGAKRSNAYAKRLNTGLAICHKQRKKPNEVAEMTVIGDVNGISLSQKAKDEEGSSITLLAIKIANTIGMVRGRRNCWVSASSSTAAPIAAINPLYNK